MELCSDLDVDTSKKTHWDRLEVAQKVVDIKAILKKTNNKSKAAKSVGVPRSTARYWLDRKGKTGVSPAVEAFFESPLGMAFLHQIVIAAQFTITQLAGGGVDMLTQFLHLSQLTTFVASSHGTLYKQAVAMEDAINRFGTEEGQRLASHMSKKKITVCQDETFHPEICLVAIEPVSNFILLEQYSEKRDAESWFKAMEEALQGLKVEIIQSTSDEGTGLIKYVEKELGAQHSPDLFHVQQELTRATSAPIAAKVKQAEKAYDTSIKIQERLEKKQSLDPEYSEKPYSALDGEIINAELNRDAALSHLNDIKKHQADVKEAKKALGQVYHPYDLTTGKAQTAEDIAEKMKQHIETIKTAAIETELSENSWNRIMKAYRVFDGMIATIVFFWTVVKQQVSSLGLSPELEALVHDVIIPGLYLQQVAKKAKGSAERKRLTKLAAELLARLALCEAWCKLPSQQREQIRSTALQCAQLFQRSSSCVEGRNGYLSLRHHSSHRLSKRKLGALTVIHNYFIRRPDETTAAERFFQSKPKNIFNYLLDNLDVSARPAKARRVTKMAA